MFLMLEYQDIRVFISMDFIGKEERVKQINVY